MKLDKFKLKKWGILLIALGVVVLVIRLFAPKTPFSNSYSTVLLDSNNLLLGARIASDGQWRFAQSVDIPDKYQTCLLTYEDQYFYWHLGVNPISIGRAVKENISAGRVVMGGSTLSMQVARLWFGPTRRSLWQKVKELGLVFWLEIAYSKSEILEMYTNNAPYGGNVVGLETAAWRYWGRPIQNLSWAEYATLAVLPNAPSLMFPGKNAIQLKKKRNKLLYTLMSNGDIDETTYQLAILEEVPEKPLPLPGDAFHITARAAQHYNGELVVSTLDKHLQKKVNEVVNEFSKNYSTNQVNNAAVVILDNYEGKIVSYVGNSRSSNDHQQMVDVAVANRSTGSILKPFLYAARVSNGALLPRQWIWDVPANYNGYTPQNYFKNYDGLVPANEALARSLNVPFVRQLQQHGINQFYVNLKELGMKSLSHPAEHYGLSLVLGGAEISLLNVCNMYSGLAQRLSYYNVHDAYSEHAKWANTMFTTLYKTQTFTQSNFSASSIYEMFSALTEAKRPVSNAGWQNFSSSHTVAWKTGTSFGNKDAWAVGVTPKYTIGVWIGNADGEGRPEVTGTAYAAPVLFRVLEFLPASNWFEKPYNDYIEAEVCELTGYLASANCVVKKSDQRPYVTTSVPVCKFHQKVYTTPDSEYRVNKACVGPNEIVSQLWLVLPALPAYYYKKKHSNYRALPPIKHGCNLENHQVMEFIYPKYPNKVALPRLANGKKGMVVFELAHARYNAEVHWYLDGEFIQRSKETHQLTFSPTLGKHQLLVVDLEGNEKQIHFEVL